MCNNIELSVIIAAWNAAGFIREALTSVVCDQPVELEIIIVDDCSTDNTAAICDEIASSDSRIKVLRMNKNGGPGIARNFGLQHAIGKYVTFLDADDRMVPGAYKTLLDFAESNRLDIARGNMAELSSFKTNDIPIHPVIGATKIYDAPADIRLLALCTMARPTNKSTVNLNYGAHCGSAIFLRELLEKADVKFTTIPHAISEDIIFCYSALSASRRVGVMKDIVYYYRINPASRSHFPASDLMTRGLDAADSLLKLIESNPDNDASDREFALRYGIDIVRSFSKNFILSKMSLHEKRKWFKAQHTHPMLRRCAMEYPLHKLSMMHRSAFDAFYHRHFWLLYGLTYGRELLRIIK